MEHPRSEMFHVKHVWRCCVFGGICLGLVFLHRLGLSSLVTFEIGSAVAILALIIGIVAIALAIGARRRHRQLERRIERFVRGSAPLNLEEILTEHSDGLNDIRSELRHLAEQVGSASASARHALTRAGFKRFAAFDSGPELSFSLALLDEEDTGFVLTAIYGRDETRVYAKSVDRGASPYPLAQEERDAIEEAGRR